MLLRSCGQKPNNECNVKTSIHRMLNVSKKHELYKSDISMSCFNQPLMSNIVCVNID